MRTLVVHPSDCSTDFLKLIYKDKPGWTIINDCLINKEELKNQIKNHDRILMMGHGTGYGLLNPKLGGYIIDDSFVAILKEKETISIWCNSDQYFRRNNIKGFHTGMIISETSEALFVLGKMPLSKEETLENMISFSNILNKCIEKSPNDMKDYILDKYSFNDEVTQYNRKNIIVI